MIVNPRPLRAARHAFGRAESEICSRTGLNALEVRFIGGAVLALAMFGEVVAMAMQCSVGAC